MEEEKHHHHLFHHKKEEEEGGPVDYKKEIKHHSHLKKVGEFGAVAAGAFALHEKHKSKKDPEHAYKHKIEEGIAATTAVGAAGFAFHEHHEKKDAKKEQKEAEGGHHHHHHHH
ncbi:abscisic stress-ripening protein 2-like [Lycium barbarum]|uniref:abscisic stress-ripening protein 2-like n=1 Tax=Lycium barbarum TaxID=112863 RepID=UPI00293F6C4C|nr:abscisic stress-ripening protein 2-like [Lycium barbarum]